LVHAVVEPVLAQGREPHGRRGDHWIYNFVKIHTTLRTTPAMAAVTERLFDVSDLVALLVESESTRVA
jgi:hypothetical protein